MADEVDPLAQMNADFLARMKAMSDEEVASFKTISDKMPVATQDFLDRCKEFLKNPIKPEVNNVGSSGPAQSGGTASNGGSAQPA